jgi:hypothetical protein
MVVYGGAKKSLDTVARFSNPDLRDMTTIQIVIAWLGHDRTSALAWLAEAKLSEGVRTRVSEMVEARREAGGASGAHDGAAAAAPPAPASEPGLATTRHMPRDRSFPLLLLCFFGSGLAALVYETSWTREFSFVFGTSELAIATVLAAYMAGLAAGSAIAGRYAHRLTRPVLAYGLLELGIAITALAVPLGVAGSRWFYVAWFGGREALAAAGGLATSLFYLICSFVILLLPTGMMGATLPLLARYAVRDDSHLGKRVGDPLRRQHDRRRGRERCCPRSFCSRRSACARPSSWPRP